MSNPSSHGRQFRLVAVQEFDYTDFPTDGVPSAAKVLLPTNAIVLGGVVQVDTAFNSAGAATLAVGDAASANTFLSAPANLKAVGSTALNAGLFSKRTGGGDGLLQSALATGATAGAGRVIIEYVIANRANEVQPN